MERNKTMKNKHITIVALAAAALATSCASEDIAEPQKQNQGDPKTVTLTASVNEAQTRVGMNKESSNSASFYWHNGDAISVLTQSGFTFSKAKFTTADETGKTTAKFTCDNMTGTPFMRALYPHNDKHSFSVSGSTVTVTYNLPAEYTYTTVESNIFPKTENGETTYPSNLTNIPMVGVITGSNIAFTHLGGLAVIRIDKMPAESGTLSVTADQQLSGDFAINDPMLASAYIKTQDATTNNTVTFTFSGASTTGAGVFYLPLATGSYTNVKFEIKDKSTNTWWMSSYSTLSINRAGVRAVSLASTDMGKIVKNTDGTYTINSKYTFVDLGLDVLWAKTNVGAESETAIGNFFAWGETETKTDFQTYTSPEITTTLDAEHDAATAQWGAGVRMPTKAEFEGLINGCTEKSWDGTKKGYTFTNNGQSIFLPVTGAKVFYSNSNHHVNTGYGCYWTSSYFGYQYSSNYAYYLEFGSTFAARTANNSYGCSDGLAVRPVADKPTVSE